MISRFKFGDEPGTCGLPRPRIRTAGHGRAALAARGGSPCSPAFDQAKDLAAIAATAELASVLPCSRTARGRDEAIARGIFGAPSLLAGSQLVWGNDRLADAIAAAAG